MQIVKTQKIEWTDVGSFRAPVYNQDINNLIKEMYENDLMDLNYIENYKLIADKDIDTLFSELNDIKQHIEDVRQRKWELEKSLMYHYNNFVSD